MYCTFTFTILLPFRYSRRSEGEEAMRYVNGTRLDDRIIRTDWDAGFEEGRQFGRGRSGGQVRRTLHSTLLTLIRLMQDLNIRVTLCAVFIMKRCLNAPSLTVRCFSGARRVPRRLRRGTRRLREAATPEDRARHAPSAAPDAERCRFRRGRLCWSRRGGGHRAGCGSDRARSCRERDEASMTLSGVAKHLTCLVIYIVEYTLYQIGKCISHSFCPPSKTNAYDYIVWSVFERLIHILTDPSTCTTAWDWDLYLIYFYFTIIIMMSLMGFMPSLEGIETLNGREDSMQIIKLGLNGKRL